ncbi:Taste receptor type 2 member 20 [Bos mutus]|uniref:Taste receptor type 2 n=1 Tax=Bos mutus TaxID=72004 RepID=L8IQD2_9CETA|nr:Taste receptor type 2 member 20 [Bos mutus]
MEDSLENIFIILINSEFITGILGNGFITLVNCIDWIKMQKVSLADQILTALAISRIGLILVIMVSLFTKESYPSSSLDIKGNKVILFSIAGLLANHFSVWLATGLSLFYFLKIVNFSNAVFLHLKFRIGMVVMVMFLGTLVLLPLSLTLVSSYINIKIHLYERNTTLNSKRRDTETFSKLIIFTVGSFLPFIISLSCFLLLMFSLLKHVKKMRSHATGFRDPSSKAYVRAMIMVISFLILLAIHFLSHLMTTFHHNVIQSELAFMLAETLGTIYPSVHSFVLILGNDKLRKASLLVLWQLRCG